MKLGKAKASNFGSYKELDFDFSDLGLSLISGTMGAGKSTIMDLACWIMYGATSKDATADEIRNWLSEDATTGQIEVGTPQGKIVIFRTRGSATQNDLYWIEEHHSSKLRGKDLKDTQRLLDERLGASIELYLIGSYMHQFSGADVFFTAKAKDRRELLEKLADLAFPVRIGDRASIVRKEKKKELEALIQTQARLEGSIEQATLNRLHTVSLLEKWQAQRNQKLSELANKATNFEDHRQNSVYSMVSKVEELERIAVPPEQIAGRLEQIKIQIKSLETAKNALKEQSKKLWEMNRDLEDAQTELQNYLKLKQLGGPCPTCRADTSANACLDDALYSAQLLISDIGPAAASQSKLVETLERAVSVEAKVHTAYDKCRSDSVSNNAVIQEALELRAKLIATKNETNRYYDELSEIKAQENPYQPQIDDQTRSIEDLKISLQATSTAVTERTATIANLNWLYDKSFDIRAMMLERAKIEINNKTNAYLEKFFDADLRINLIFDGSDKLDVSISNDGNQCSYKQLSGGERCMLKLAFNLSLMKRAEDVAGVKFSTVMLDEALNGLDADMKIKAFNMLQALESEYSSVLLIDHNAEFKNLFSSQFNVIKDNGYSHLQHEK